MEDQIKVVSVELLADGLLIEFDDGEQALYPSTLLWSMLDSAQLTSPTN